MPRPTTTFSFGPQVPLTEAEATLRLAILAVESLHGANRVQLEMHIHVDRGQRCCSIDNTTDVGRTLAVIFSGYVLREFGEENVSIVSDGNTVCTSGDAR